MSSSVEVKDFVVGVKSRRYPVPNEFETLSRIDDLTHALKLSTSIGKKFSQPTNGSMNRLHNNFELNFCFSKLIHMTVDYNNDVLVVVQLN